MIHRHYCDVHGMYWEHDEISILCDLPAVDTCVTCVSDQMTVIAQCIAETNHKGVLLRQEYGNLARRLREMGVEVVR